MIMFAGKGLACLGGCSLWVGLCKGFVFGVGGLVVGDCSLVVWRFGVPRFLELRIALQWSIDRCGCWDRECDWSSVE